ncbi:MAG: eukaryotic-like serine/threonine-protein kinase [Desulfonauticus sp.]|nr:eukaryotic-like serine/threonine-protein kinase [Desulfonauticus sp.]
MWVPFKEIKFPSDIKVENNSFLGKYLVKNKIYRGVNSDLYLLEKKGKFYVLKTQNNLDIDGFLAWQNEARFINFKDDNRFIFPLEENNLGLIFKYYPLKDLRWLIKDKNIGLAQKLKFLASFLYLISCLHTLGIVHHDLKPENILWNPQNNEIKLLDFGFAWLEGRDDFWKDTNLPKGTPDYIAPECLKGIRGLKSSDVFSFGVLAYEFLTGNLPFIKAKSTLGTSLRKWQKIKPLSQYDLELSPKLIEVVEGCLKEDYKQRPEILEVAEAFSQFSPYDLLADKEVFTCKLQAGGDPLVRKGYLEGKPLVCCFVRPDSRLSLLLEKGKALAQEGYGVLFISFIPETLTEFEKEEFKAKLFGKLAGFLPLLRQEKLCFGIRLWSTPTYTNAALEVLRKYEPKVILLGKSKRGNISSFFKPGLNKKIGKSEFASNLLVI